MARPIRSLLVSTVALALVAASCGSNGDSNADSNAAESLSVATAIFPVQEAAQRVGGQAAEVSNITPPGVEPHDLELTPEGVEIIQSADVVLYLGGGFQPAVEDAVSGSEGMAVDLLAGLDTFAPPPEEAEEGISVDPHVWLDPRLYADLVGDVAEALSQAAPDSASTFRSNASAFQAELEDLNRQYQEVLANCERDIIVTNHAAFGYLAKAYGLTQEPISGVAPEAEPGPARLAELKDLVEREEITTIFTEELVSPEVAEVLAEEAGVQTRVLATLDAFPEQEAASADYLSLMLDNLSTLREALGCS